MQQVAKRVLGNLLVLSGCLAVLAGVPAQAVLTLHCQWGMPGNVPTVFPGFTQVMMMPIVMDFGGPPLGTSKVAFISFANGNQANLDRAGVLRVIDLNCNELARFPDPNCPPIPILPNCPATLSADRLAPISGLAAGNIDNTPDVEIVGVIGGPATATNSNHKQVIALNLVGGCIVPKWCSPPLAGTDFIFGASYPAIAQLDRPPHPASTRSEVVIDDKVYDFTGGLRYSGLAGPRSRAAVVANVVPGNKLPQVITGRGLYRSNPPAGPVWTGSLFWTNTGVSNNPLDYPAVAELEALSPGPEIVVTDTLATTLRVLTANGVQLASTPIPNPGCINGGGPPMIGEADGVPGPEIGVASCSRYTLFKYNPGSSPTLTQVWSKPTNDPSAQTASTLFNSPIGQLIYYADSQKLWVFFGPNGNVLQSITNSSATALEGPVIAAFDTGVAPGRVVVVANDYAIGGTGQRGVRIFDEPGLGPARSFWNQHSYHATNVLNSTGTIPTVELPSWVLPARNTCRVQQFP
jgi:hypothetical protein